MQAFVILHGSFALTLAGLRRQARDIGVTVSGRQQQRASKKNLFQV